MNKENSIYDYKWELIAINKKDKEKKIVFRYEILPNIVGNILREITVNEMGNEIEVSEDIYEYIKENIGKDFQKYCEGHSNMINEKWVNDFLNRQFDKVDTRKIIYLLEEIERRKN